MLFFYLLSLQELYSSIKARWEELSVYQHFPTNLATRKKQCRTQWWCPSLLCSGQAMILPKIRFSPELICQLLMQHSPGYQGSLLKLIWCLILMILQPLLSSPLHSSLHQGRGGGFVDPMAGVVVEVVHLRRTSIVPFPRSKVTLKKNARRSTKYLIGQIRWRRPLQLPHLPNPSQLSVVLLTPPCL